MKGKDHYLFLQEAFLATFMDELLPGIFHNFANPLNGIMGRSKLMQRRLVEFVKKIEKRYPGIEGEMGAEYAKLVSDINSINNESDKFFNMFCVSTGKFYAIGSQGVETLNLSRLVEAELGFADFYLDFKHNITKEICLDGENPDIEGVTAFYSMALWMLIRQAMMTIKEASGETFSIATDHDDQWVILKISYIDAGALVRWLLLAEEGGTAPDSSAGERGEENPLIRALMLLRQGNDAVRITYDGDGHRLTIQIPYRQKQGRPEVRS